MVLRTPPPGGSAQVHAPTQQEDFPMIGGQHSASSQHTLVGKSEGNVGKKRRRDDSPMRHVGDHMKEIVSGIEEVCSFLQAPESKINKVKAAALCELLSNVISCASELHGLAAYYAGQYSAVKEVLEGHLAGRARAMDTNEGRMEESTRPSLSPLMRVVEEIKRDVSGGYSTPVMNSVGKMERRIAEQSQRLNQLLDHQSKSYRDAATNSGSGAWTMVGRRGRVGAPMGSPHVPSHTLDGPVHIAQVRADLRARIKEKGGPQPSKATHTFLVTGAEGDRDVMRKLSTGINPKDLGLDIKSSRSTMGGGVVVEVNGPVNIKSLQDNDVIRGMGFTVREAPRKLPRILVHGVPSSFTADELQAEFWKSCSAEGDWKERKAEFLPIHKAGPRGLPETKWVIEVSQAVRAMIVGEGKIRLGWIICRVVDHVSVSRCYKCQKFGHVAKGCNRDEICGWCSEKNHSFKDCPTRDQPACCTNCKEAGRPNQHDAGSLGCPSYRIAIENQVRLTDYGKHE
ncbi:hypothetical protein GE061_020237 [Apolygus lucorum]|uniref:CCHC-type domain-containing protein n=1 Tax=Apolygus lucorum TaxID=248454 RepID=A0A8S9WJV4_APOLU|nr:hypothetical protein GE061_020237 [Apolygus lucorum]